MLGQKDKRVVATATNDERRMTTTLVASGNAAVNYIPPKIIFKQKRHKLNEVSDSSWINIPK